MSPNGFAPRKITLAIKKKTLGRYTGRTHFHSLHKTGDEDGNDMRRNGKAKSKAETPGERLVELKLNSSKEAGGSERF